MATEGVDSDDVRCLLVPGAVLDPIRRRHLLPRVVELGVLLEDLHHGEGEFRSRGGRRAGRICVKGGRRGRLFVTMVSR